jgi:hypothetical protein
MIIIVVATANMMLMTYGQLQTPRAFLTIPRQ